MKIAVLGVTGVLGRNVIPRLVEARLTVRAGVRGNRTTPKTKNVQDVAADILDPRSLDKLIEGCEVVVNVASSIPRADGKGGDWDVYDRIRRDGTRNLIQAGDKARVAIVAQSIAMLHCTDQSVPQDERSPMEATGVRASGLDLEKTFLEWRGDWRIVRGGALYGPGTTTDDDCPIDTLKEMLMTQEVSPLDVALAFTEAWTSHNLDSAAKYVADDVVFDGPMQKSSTKKEYMDGLTRLSPAVKSVRIISAFGDGDHALLMYDLITEPYGTLTCAKYFTVTDGKIKVDKLTFDSHLIRSAKPM